MVVFYTWLPFSPSGTEAGMTLVSFFVTVFTIIGFIPGSDLPGGASTCAGRLNCEVFMVAIQGRRSFNTVAKSGSGTGAGMTLRLTFIT